uniref:Uncharacterized protein n=1 Tax=Haemonchus contortus TaxID=6289 RepID=A0A7I5EA31_HAECO
MPSSLTSSTTSHGQHAAAPPYPAGSCWLRYIALASRQAAPCLPASRAAPLLVASTQQHHNILQAHDSSGILPWPQGKQHHAFQSHEQHHFSWPAHGSTTISCVLMTAPSYCPVLKASSTMPSSLMRQHHFSWPAHGSTTISCGLMLAPVYCPGLPAQAPHISGHGKLRHCRGQGKQQPLLLVSRAAPLLVASTRPPPYPACS